MRKVTRYVVGNFMEHRVASRGNTASDGTRLTLHGNIIAQWERGKSFGQPVWRLAITLAGWNTSTTREQLRTVVAMWEQAQGREPSPCGPFNVKGEAELYGEPWDGAWCSLPLRGQVGRPIVEKRIA